MPEVPSSADLDVATERAYIQAVGILLRDARTLRRLSLRQVEMRSGGRLSRAAVGSYERGDRAATVPRLAEIADFYQVPLASLLPGAAAPEPLPVRLPPVRTPPLVIDLRCLWTQRDAGSRAAVRFIAGIQAQRAEIGGARITLRSSDLGHLAMMHGVALDALVEQWRVLGAIVDDEDK
jgi:transcriptional regulator with XRE-family HTH domain